MKIALYARKTLLRKNGIQVISINEPSEATPTGRLLEGIIESLDEFYSDNLGQEVSRGMKESVSRGFYLARKPPYGYRKVRVKDGDHERTKLDLDPAQAEIVKNIFGDTLLGTGVTDIVRRLNSQSVPSPKGKGWNKSGLHYILSNEIFTGTMVWGIQAKRLGEPLRIPDYCPAIIDKATFDAVQRLIAGRAPKVCHPRVTTSRFLLSGITKCGHCGKALVGKNTREAVSFRTTSAVHSTKKGLEPARQNTSTRLNLKQLSWRKSEHSSLMKRKSVNWSRWSMRN